MRCPGCGYRFECPCGCQSCPTCDPIDGAPSRVSGAIGRGLADAQAGYRQQLGQLWAEVVAALPDD